MKTDSSPSNIEEAALKKAVSPERYAEVLAHLLHFRDADPSEVVRRLGVAPEVWALADAFWAGELELGVRRQQRDLALRFSTTLARTRARLAKKGPSLSAIGTLDTAAPAAEAKAAEKDKPSPVGPTPSAVLPSFMAAPAATPMAAPVPVTPTPVIAPPAVPTARPRTMAIPAVAAPVEEKKVFAEGVTPQVALKNAIEHADATQGPRVAKGPVKGLTEPAQADEIAAIAQRLMPFGPSGAPTGAAPRGAPPKGPGAEAEAPRADSAAALPLERHASLHVELTSHPERRAELLQRYGLSAEQYAKIDAAWQARLEQESSLRTAWEGACAQYRAWLLRARPSV